MLDQLKKLHEAVLPGYLNHDPTDRSLTRIVDGDVEYVACDVEEDEGPMIAAACNALPALIAVAEAAEIVAGRMHGNAVVADLAAALARSELARRATGGK